MSRFERWCSFNGSIALPASPSIVAAFIADHDGLDTSTLWAEIAALDQQHEELGYAPPGRSTVAIAAFNNIHHVEPPRSWSKDEKHLFTVLPWAIQLVLARREADRDKALNRIQNEAANKRKANGVHKTEAAA